MKTLIVIRNGVLEYAATDMSEGEIILVEDDKLSNLEFDSVNCSERILIHQSRQFQKQGRRDKKEALKIVNHVTKPKRQ